MSNISTHVLDAALGRPVAAIPVALFLAEELLVSTVTNNDGRCPALLPPGTPLVAATYRVVFDLASTFPDHFYPQITIRFRVSDPNAHHHVPLLLSPFGYTTYRGS